VINTEAWVLHENRNSSNENGSHNGNGSHAGKIDLRLETFSLPDLKEYEVLAEPVVGCWEGNMSHAVTRRPVDICKLRRENSVVIGNAGVVRVLKPGPGVTLVKEGDLCLVFCNGSWDEFGYPKKIYGYDAEGTVAFWPKKPSCMNGSSSGFRKTAAIHCSSGPPFRCVTSQRGPIGRLHMECGSSMRAKPAIHLLSGDGEEGLRWANCCWRKPQAVQCT